MELLFKIIGIAFCGAILALILKKSNPEFAMAVTVMTSLFIFTLLFSLLRNVMADIRSMAGLSGVDLSYLGIVIKVILIAYFSEYAGCVLEDAGESAIAKKIELAGKGIIFLIALPIVEALFQLMVALF